MSQPRDIQVACDPDATPAGGAPGRQVIVAIGIDRYHHWPLLSNAVRDARGAVALFDRLGFELVRELIDGQATAKAIQSLVTDELRTLGQDDSLVVFFAGHGSTRSHPLGDRVVKTGYLVPVDAQDQAATWIELESWLRAVSLLPPRHILMILDACHSGIALGPIVKWRDRGSWRDVPLATLRARRSRRIITSALDDQVALDSGPVDGHSLFTGCLIEGLTHGISADRGAVTTGSELGLYLQRRVGTFPESRQTPDFGTFDFDDRGEIVIPLLSGRQQRPASRPGSPPSDEVSDGLRSRSVQPMSRPVGPLLQGSQGSLALPRDPQRTVELPLTARQADAEGLIDELARAFDTADAADQLLWAVELNLWIDRDIHRTDRQSYWRRVCQLAEQKLANGVCGVLAEAAWMHPGNPHFQRFAYPADRVTRAIAAGLEGAADPSKLLYDVLAPGLRPAHLPAGTPDGGLRRIVRTCFKHARNRPMQELAAAIRCLDEATAQRIIDGLSAEGLLQHGDDPGHASWNRAEPPRPYVWICRRQLHVPRYDDKIREQLAHQPVWLWGPRHYGKSWTIRCICDQLGGRAKLCILDVSDFAEMDRETPEAFLREAERRIADQLLGTAAPDRPRSDASIAPAARFERQLAGLIRDRRIHYLLLAIDEIQDLSPRARVAVLSALVGYHCSASAMTPLSPDRFGLMVGSRGNPFELLPTGNAAALARKCHILEIEEFDAAGGEVVALAEKFEHRPGPEELAQIAKCVSGHPSLLGQLFARWRQDDELPALSDRDVRRRVFEHELDELRRLLADGRLDGAFLRIASRDGTEAVGHGAMTALRDLGLVSRDGRDVSCGLYRDLKETS